MTDLSEELLNEAERLTRLAIDAVDDGAARAYRSERDELLAEQGYEARVRSDDENRVLVCYPTDWVVDGVVDPADIEDTGRAIERPLRGPGDPDDWGAVESHNRALARAVELEYGSIHGRTAHAFADFMGNHYARRIETAGRRECQEFLEEYLPRNAWPSEAQLEAAHISLQRTFEAAGTEPPPLPEFDDSAR